MINFHFFIKNNISVIPTKQDKSPYTKYLRNGKWDIYQKEFPNTDEIKSWSKLDDICVAIVCGAISGNLECMDFDNHAQTAKDVITEFKRLVDLQAPELWDKLVLERSQSQGYHIFYRCKSAVEGNQKLARQLLDGKKDTFIETRGEGGYVIVSPSPGYTILQNDFSKLPVLTDEERSLLLEIARSFNQIAEQDKSYPFPTITNSDGTTEPRTGDIFNEYDNHKELLENVGWTLVYTNQQGIEGWRRPGKNKGISATYNAIPDRFYVFSSNVEHFEMERTYDTFAIYTMLNCGGDFKEAAKRIKKDYSFLFDKTTIKTNGVAKQKQKTPENDLQEKIVFWSEVIDSSKKPRLTIDKSKIIEFLEYFHFGKMWIDTNVSQLIRVQNNIVSEQTPETITDFLKGSILCLDVQLTPNFTKFDVWEACLKMIDKIKNLKFLETLQAFKLNFIKDTKDKAFFFFKNCIVEVNKKEVKPISYGTLPGYIWKEQIIPYNFNLLDEEYAYIPEHSIFGRFIIKVCSRPDKYNPDDRELWTLDIERYEALTNAIGYLMHTYHDPALTKVVIFCEEKMSDYSGESNGQTGKGLTAYAIGLLRKRIKYDGRMSKYDDDKFFFQKITPDTQLIYLDDVKKKFDLGIFFSAITDGITIERKGKPPIDIPAKDTPKMLISTNDVLADDSDSYRARKFEIEFSPYFSAQWTPRDEFKMNFFESGWSDDSPEWDNFFNFMLQCVKSYLYQGLTAYKHVNLEDRKLRALMPVDFIEYADSLHEDMKRGKIVNLEEIYNEFSNIYKEHNINSKYSINMQLVSKWLTLYFQLNDIKVESERKSIRDKENGRIRKQRFWKLLEEQFFENEKM